MKYGCLFFCLLLLCTHTWAQIPVDAISMEEAQFDSFYTKRIVPKVTGKLLNVSSENLKKYAISYSLVTPFATRQVKKTAVVQADGSFTLVLDYPFPYQQVWFSLGEMFYAELMVHKDLYIELDIKKLEALKESSFNTDGVSYLGSDGPLTTYLNNYILYRRPQQQALSKQLSALLHAKIRPKEFPMAAYDKVYEGIWQIARDYISENPSPYNWLLENEVMSGYYSDIIPFYWSGTMNDSLWDKIKRHKTYLVSNNGSSFYNYLTAYVQFLPSGRNSVSWMDVDGLPDLEPFEKAVIDSLKTYASLDSAKRMAPFTSENTLKWSKMLSPRISKILFKKSLASSIRRLDSLFTPAKADFLKIKLVEKTNLAEQKQSMEYIIAGIHTEWSKKVAQLEYEKILAHFNEAQQVLKNSTDIKNSSIGFGIPILQTSFGARLYQVKEMKAVDFLKKLRAAFPAKSFFLDLWATWCAPCLSEMPYSKTLQKATQDLPIVFVYLCTTNSSDLEKWKLKVTELKQPGIHFFIDESLDNEISRLFSFGGYPGYVLINGEGKPMSSERPSSLSREKISALLK